MGRHKGSGGKRKFETPEDLAVAVEEYFDKCEAEDVFPDEAGMRIFLNAGYSTYYKWLKIPEYQEIFQRAQERRESFLVRRMVGEPKLAQGCLNALKQPKNGGYTDGRPEKGTGEVKVYISLKGCEDFNPFG